MLVLLLLATTLAFGQPAETENGDATSEFESLVSEGQDLIDAGQHDAAIRLLEDGLTKYAQFSPAERAKLHTRLAYAYNHRSDFDAIRRHVDAAIDLVSDEPTARDVHADALSARAMYFSATRQVSAYLEAARAELDARRKLPLPESKLDVALINVALANYLNGDYAAAERYLEDALSHARRYPTNPRRVTTIRTNLGAVYNQRKEHRAAARMWRQAIAEKREAAPGSESLATLLANLGSALNALGRYQAAEEALSEALVIQREQIPESVDIAITIYTLGKVAEFRQRYQRAEELYREAMTIIDRKIPDAPGAAFSRRSLGGLLIDKGRLDEASTLLGKAVKLTGLTNNPGQHASTLFQLGRLELARNARDAARMYWHKAVEALEIQYDLLGGSALTVANFSEGYEPLYRRLSQLLIDEGEYGEAIRLLESYRNRSLLERLDVNRVLRRSEAGRQLLGDFNELRNEARSIISPDDVSDGPEMGPEQRLARLQRRRDDRVAQALQVQPHLAELLTTEIDWSPERANLGDGQRILYYSLGDERSDLMVVGPDEISAHRLPPGAEIATLVERFRILVQRPEADPAPLERVSRRLHEVLLAPASRQLADADSLLLRADGVLLLLPFAALRDGGDQYLVEKYRIRRLYTLSPEPQHAPEAAERGAEFSGFAFAGGDSGDSGLRGDPAPLRFVGEEIARAAAVFGKRASRYVNQAATETRARTIGGSRIVHFATHAFADAVQPLSSHISLAADERNDGHLELWEVMADLELDAGLVVLSACQTALGPSFAGEGLLGLAKGFAFAGADSVVASLWAIDDASTMHLMEFLYLDLAAGRPTVEALNQAQRAMLAGEIPKAHWLGRLLFSTGSAPDYSHPYYWAPFTLSATR